MYSPPPCTDSHSPRYCCCVRRRPAVAPSGATRCQCSGPGTEPGLGGRSRRPSHVWNNIVHTIIQYNIVYFKRITILAGYPASLETLSPGLSPPPSLVPLSPLLFVPAFYPPSLGLPGFAQDNCIPEILFKPWSLVTLKFSPLTPAPPPPPVGWGGVGVTCFGYFFGNFFFLLIFSAVREIYRTFEILTPQPPPGTLDPPGWGG